MRLSTKFSAFISLLTGLTIFVTLIGCSLSFYNAIQGKLANRVHSVASVIDSRLVSTPFPELSHQLDELMAPVEITRVEIKQGGKTIFSHNGLKGY